MRQFVEFKKYVSERNFKPVYLLVGDDEFLIRSAMNMLKGLVSLPELNVSFYNDESDINEMISVYSQLPVMSDYRLMECHFSTKPADQVKKFLSYVRAHVNEGTLVVFASTAMPSCIAANVEYFETVGCNRLDKPTLLKWLATQAAKRNANITTEAAALLIDYCGSFLTRISVEFNKLADAKLDGGVIEARDVRMLVSPDNDFKIYELSEALARKNVDRTYEIYESLIVNTAPVAILGALYSHFRRLLYTALTADKEMLARYLKVKPFAVEMASRQAKLYTPLRLKKICDRLSQIDADFKSGKIEDKLALDSFIAETLCAA